MEATRAVVFGEAELQEGRRLNGYYVIVTNETAMPDDDVNDIYRGLWRMEGSFKVTKPNLAAGLTDESFALVGNSHTQSGAFNQLFHKPLSANTEAAAKHNRRANNGQNPYCIEQQHTRSACIRKCRTR